MEKAIVAMEHITKSFPGVRALEDVSLTLHAGETLALIGENGAGKSTLMKCLMGMYRPDQGTITVDGNQVEMHTPQDALTRGISMIHQELNPVVGRSVMHNIWLGREPLNKLHLVDHAEMERRTKALLDFLEMDMGPREIMGSLTVAKMQMVEIAKALSYDSKVIIMDEPTSALTSKESDHLFTIIGRLKEKGVAIIYISHKMNEIFTIADTLCIMRDGKNVRDVPMRETDPEEVISLMVGRKLDQMFPKVEIPIGEVRLKVQGLSSPGRFSDVSFEVRRGEIFGVSGLVGAGRTEVMETLFGIRRKSAGTVHLDGKELDIQNPTDAIRHGLAFLTEDRRATGIYPMLSVAHNTAIANSRRYLNKLRLLSVRRMNVDVDEYVQKLQIKTPTLLTAIQNLSGGNQQKVLLARWLLTEPTVLILDEPTRGIDVGAKAEIHRLIGLMAQAGKSIILISSELPEIIAMSDRVLVMHEGHVTGQLSRGELSQESIMRLAVK